MLGDINVSPFSEKARKFSNFLDSIQHFQGFSNFWLLSETHQAGISRHFKWLNQLHQGH